MTEPGHARSLPQWLDELRHPTDGAGLAAFRIGFGTLMLVAVLRFAALGWIDELYAAPSYFFSYFGFDWVRPWPRWGLYLHFALMAASAALLALGYRTRLAALSFGVLFTYAELFDKSTYLNHYYLVSLLSLLLTVVPAGACWSLDARRLGARQVPRGAYWLLKTQMALVYLYAGFAKLDGDWLLRAQPLRLWLATYTDVPVLGPLVESSWLAPAMSWSGMLFDLGVVPALLHGRTRPFAFGAAAVFHVSLWLLFPIGVFPWVMLVAISVFASPAWPRRFVHVPRVATPPRATPRWLVAAAMAYLALQVLVPLRFVLYPGRVNWTEQGFRFSWRVMLIEKAGQVEFRVVSPERGESSTIYPRRELSRLQYRMMSTQPDMIHQYALHLAERFRARGDENVQVFADAWVSFNGRPSQRLIDPTVDLASRPRSLAPSDFILPLGEAPGR